jgi:hypothetical protein
VIIAVLLIYLFFNQSPITYIPVWSDELDYWQEINAFVHHGFQSGFFTFNELTAELITPFGPHGPGFITFFGIPALVSGWHFSTGIFFNMILVIVAIFIWLITIHPSRLGMILLSIFLCAFFPIWYYLPSTMQESVHQAGAILLSIPLIRYHNKQWSYSRYLLISLLLLLPLSFIRYTWLLYLIPGAVLNVIRNRRKTSWIGLLAIFISILVGFIVFAKFVSPYPTDLNGFTLKVAFDQSLGTGWRFYLSHLVSNIYLILNPDFRFITSFILRLDLALILILAIYSYFRSRRPDSRELPVIIVLLLAPIILAQVLRYEVARWIDLRFFAPFLLITFLLLLTSHDNLSRFLLFVTCLLWVVALPWNLPIFAQNHKAHFTNSADKIAQVSMTIRDFIMFKPDQDQWCNTIATNLLERDGQMNFLSIPEGMGITYLKHLKEYGPETIKSGYLLMNDTATVMKKPTSGILLVDLGDARLYKNTAVECK